MWWHKAEHWFLVRRELPEPEYLHACDLNHEHGGSQNMARVVTPKLDSCNFLNFMKVDGFNFVHALFQICLSIQHVIRWYITKFLKMPTERIKGKIFKKSLNSKKLSVDGMSMKLFLKIILYGLCYFESLGRFLYCLLCNYKKNI